MARNIRISELERRSYLDGTEIIPVSWRINENSYYNSYGSYIKDIVSYIDTDTSSYINTNISYFKRDLGQYNNGKYSDTYNIDLSVAYTTSAIDINGNKIEKNNYCISNVISLKEGTLYFIELSELLDDVAPFAKVVKTTCCNIDGYKDVTVYKEDGDTIKVNEPIYSNTTTETIQYEPITKHYQYIKKQGMLPFPTSGLALFYATSDMEIVISAKKEDIHNKQFSAINSALFSDIAEKYTEKNGTESGVIAETLASLDARLSAIEASHGIAQMIDTMTMPKYRGNDIIIVKDHGPNITTSTGLPYDNPNYIGQIWIDTSSKTAYISVYNDVTCWKKITTSENV